MRLLGFHSPDLQHCTGLTLGELARRRGQRPEETMIDLVLEDRSRVNVAYFMMDEGNVRRQLALPWVSLCSDEESLAPRGAFLRQTPHPRAYGAFARFLGHYVRDERLVDLAEAIRRLTSLPARNLRLVDRGEIRAGAFADLVVFDPARIADRATWSQPHQFAVGRRPRDRQRPAGAARRPPDRGAPWPRGPGARMEEAGARRFGGDGLVRRGAAG